MDRTGPVPAAVRSAGYLSEEEGKFSCQYIERKRKMSKFGCIRVDEEEGGSSVEEEDDEEEHEHGQHVHQHGGEHGHLGAQRSDQHDNQEDMSELPNPIAAGGDAPAYEAPSAGSGVQIGESGYATEKKSGDASAQAGTSQVS